MSASYVAPQDFVEDVLVSDHPVGVQLDFDPLVPHRTVKERELSEALGVSRVRYHSRQLVVTLSEGERWTDAHAERFAEKLHEVFGHRFVFTRSAR